MAVVYVVTIAVDPQIEQEWLTWMRLNHVPEVLATNCFAEHRWLKVVEPPHRDGWPTYAVHYTAESRAKLDEYLQQHAPRLREQTTQKFGTRFGATRQILEVLHTA